MPPKARAEDKDKLDLGEKKKVEEYYDKNEDSGLSQRDGVPPTPTLMNKSLMDDLNEEQRLDVKLLENDYDDIFEVSENDIKQLQHRISDKGDILGFNKLESAQWNKLTTTSAKEEGIKRLALATASPDQIKDLIANIKDKADMLTLGGINVNATVLFITNESRRAKQMISYMVKYAKQAIKEFSGDTTESVDDDEHRAELMKEIVVLERILNCEDLDIANSKDYFPRLKEMEIIKFMVLMMNHTDKKLCGIIQNAVSDSTINHQLRERLSADDRENVVLDRKAASPLEHMLDISVTAMEVITKLNMNNTGVSYEAYLRAREKVSQWEIMFSTTAKEKGWQLSLIEFGRLVTDAESIGRELARVNPAYEGAVRGQLHLFWEFLPKLNATQTSACTDKYFQTIRQRLATLYDEAKLITHKSSGGRMTDEERWQRLLGLLYELDNQNKGSQKVKNDIKEITLNTDIKQTKKKKKQSASSKGGNSAGGGGVSSEAAPTNTARICAHMLRKGHCLKKGCKFKNISKQDWESRPTCKMEAVASGNCTFGDNCIYRHETDKYVANPKCVHARKGSINQLSEEGEDEGTFVRMRNPDGDLVTLAVKAEACVDEEDVDDDSQ